MYKNIKDRIYSQEFQDYFNSQLKPKIYHLELLRISYIISIFAFFIMYFLLIKYVISNEKIYSCIVFTGLIFIFIYYTNLRILNFYALTFQETLSEKLFNFIGNTILYEPKQQEIENDLSNIQKLNIIEKSNYIYNSDYYKLKTEYKQKLVY